MKRKGMRKVLWIAAICVMMAGLSACGTTGKQAASNESAASPQGMTLEEAQEQAAKANNYLFVRDGDRFIPVDVNRETGWPVCFVESGKSVPEINGERELVLINYTPETVEAYHYNNSVKVYDALLASSDINGYPDDITWGISFFSNWDVPDTDSVVELNGVELPDHHDGISHKNVNCAVDTVSVLNLPNYLIPVSCGPNFCYAIPYTEKCSFGYYQGTTYKDKTVENHGTLFYNYDYDYNFDYNGHLSDFSYYEPYSHLNDTTELQVNRIRSGYFTVDLSPLDNGFYTVGNGIVEVNR